MKINEKKQSNSNKVKIIIDSIINVSIFYYLIAFCLVVIGAGIFYYYSTPYGHGLGQNSKALTDITFLKSLYFSVVTISSLGYGDMHPMGFSKIIACLEVIFGLVFLGFFIAKVASRRMSYHIQRLFSSDAETRIESFTNDFEQLQSQLSKAMKEIGTIYQKTPSKKKKIFPEKKKDVIQNFTNLIFSLNSKSNELKKYISLETEHDKYFTLVTVEAVLLLGDNIDRILKSLQQLIISLTTESRKEILDKNNINGISKFLDLLIELCQIVKQHSNSEKIKSCFQQLSSTCKLVPINDFVTPSLIIIEQPDQIQPKTDDPQEIN